MKFKWFSRDFFQQQQQQQKFVPVQVRMIIFFSGSQVHDVTLCISVTGRRKEKILRSVRESSNFFPISPRQWIKFNLLIPADCTMKLLGCLWLMAVSGRTCTHLNTQIFILADQSVCLCVDRAAADLHKTRRGGAPQTVATHLSPPGASPVNSARRWIITETRQFALQHSHSPLSKATTGTGSATASFSKIPTAHWFEWNGSSCTSFESSSSLLSMMSNSWSPIN